ncbi:hypothetical protein D3C81_534620 [compost metagenome]
MGLKYLTVSEVGLAWDYAGGVGRYITLSIEPENVAAYRHGEGLVEQQLLAHGGR